MRIKKGDTVAVITGKDANKQGVVSRVIPANRKVVVDGLNIIKRHKKPKKYGEKGQILEMAAPVDVSNVMIVCLSCNKPTRVGYVVSDKSKERVCKKCSAKF